jgi:hypothetical protein
MPNVDLQRPLSVPAVPARESIASILHQISARVEGWDDFSLFVNFGTLGLPDVGYVLIPVSIEDIEEVTEPRHEIRFKLHARRLPEAFPRLEAALGIDSTGPSASLMWLAGSYTMPLSVVGAAVDRLFSSAAATKSLENMLEELAEATTAYVERRERTRANYRLIFNVGS